MVGFPVTFVASGGIPVTEMASGGSPFEEVASGGIAATLVASGGLGLTRGSGVAAFAFQPETTLTAAAFSTPPTAARKRTMDRVYKRMTAAGLLAKTSRFYLIGADEDASLTCWKTQIKAVKHGTPTHTANDGWTALANGDYLDTLMLASALSQDNIGHYCWTKGAAVSTASSYGAINAGAAGISLVPQNTTNSMLGRCSSVSGTVAANGHSNASGLHGVSRNNAANMTGSCNGVAKSTVAQASVALPALVVTLLGINNNGAFTAFSPIKHSAFWFGQALTEAEERILTGIIGEYLEAVQYGEPVIEDPGIGTAAISAQCIFYGTTGQSIVGALQAARAGKTVAIVGGWRDRHLGGMSGGGLGFTDFDNEANLGGLPRYVITRMNAIEGAADTKFKFEPRRFQWVMRELLNPALNGGFTIPIYLTRGVSAVTKSGTTITSFTTADGRTVTGSQFLDGSYEGDLIRLAGVSYFLGREPTGASIEGLDGQRIAGASTNGQNTHQFWAHLGGSIVDVDPWVTPNTPASGKLPGVHGVSSAFTPALHDQLAAGSTDSKVQSYNFRLTMTNSNLVKVPLPSTPPPGYDVANYELLLRYLALSSTLNMTELFIQSSLNAGNSAYDFNAQWGFSTDKFGSSWAYPLATYATRETIWKDHWNFILGLFYLLQYNPTADARITGTLTTEALTWGFHQNHYYAPHENDQVFWMPQLYVREGIRMVANARLDGNDMVATDGTTPRISTNTIAVASYAMDSHAVGRLAYERLAGTWSTWNEGNFLSNSGGTNQAAPIPIEVCVPKAAECTNLCDGFGTSATHVAFGSIRMEFTAMQIGQSMGQAMAQAITDGVTIQNVNYATVRASLLASAALSGEVAPILPQLN